MRSSRCHGRSGARSLVIPLAAALAMLLVAAHVHGQKATEQFIPIGQSPGISGRYSVIGVIADVNARARTVTIPDSGVMRTARITEKTRIFLDRSKLRRSNLSGSFADLYKGRRAEVKFVHPQRRDSVDWVKVEVDR